VTLRLDCNVAQAVTDITLCERERERERERYYGSFLEIGGMPVFLDGGVGTFIFLYATLYSKLESSEVIFYRRENEKKKTKKNGISTVIPHYVQL